MAQSELKYEKNTKEELITFFKIHGIEFVEEEDTIKVLGNVVYASIDLKMMRVCQSTILRVQNIVYEEYTDIVRIVIDDNLNIYELRLTKNVKAYYKYPYLVFRVS